MNHDWLLEELRGIEAYAILNKLDWLVPLINKANVAANRELGSRPNVSNCPSGAGQVVS